MGVPVRVNSRLLRRLARTRRRSGWCISGRRCWRMNWKALCIWRRRTRTRSARCSLVFGGAGPGFGVLVKLAGKATLNEATGQITTSFANTPQLPFEELDVAAVRWSRARRFRRRRCAGATRRARRLRRGRGARRCSPLRILRCSMWPRVLGAGRARLRCRSRRASMPRAASLQAGGFSPFSLTLANPDGDQALSGVAVHLPPGVAALLSSVTPCAEPQASSRTNAARKA